MGQRPHLFDQRRVGVAQLDLLQQRTDATLGPDPRDVTLGDRVLGQNHVPRVVHSAPRDLAADPDPGRAGLLVAPENSDRLAGKEVTRRRRKELHAADLRDVQHRVGQDGIGDLTKELLYRRIDRLTRLHVQRVAP